MISELQQGIYHKVLLVGRDAEVLYDAAKTVISGTAYENSVVLFPGSMDFIDFYLVSKVTTGEAFQEMKEFFAQFGITEELFKNTERTLVLDTGFMGTVGTELWYVIQKLFAVEMSLVRKTIDLALISASENARARRYMPLTNGQMTLSQM